MKLSEFIHHHAAQSFVIAEALASMLEGLGLVPNEAHKVKTIIEELRASSATLLEKFPAPKVET